VLPRVLAGEEITRADLAALANGGYCLGCKVCTWPKCSFGA
jgi:formylmethanofuran dehydrogenase subunit E